MFTYLLHILNLFIFYFRILEMWFQGMEVLWIVLTVSILWPHLLMFTFIVLWALLPYKRLFNRYSFINILLRRHHIYMYYLHLTDEQHSTFYFHNNLFNFIIFNIKPNWYILKMKSKNIIYGITFFFIHIYIYFNFKAIFYWTDVYLY